MARLNSLERGMRHFSSLDNFGGGMPVDELFPELADEDERVGVNFWEPEYRQVERKMGSLIIDESVDLNDISYDDDDTDFEEYLNQLTAEEYAATLSEQEIQILKADKNGLLDIIFPNKFVPVEVVHDLNECATMHRYGVIPILMTGGVAICDPFDACD